MRKIVVSEFMSLDGVMQAPGGKDEDTEGGFTHGGWTWPYWHDEIGAHFAEVMSESASDRENQSSPSSSTRMSPRMIGQKRRKFESFRCRSSARWNLQMR